MNDAEPRSAARPPDPTELGAGRVWLPWFVGLRWVAVAGQLCAAAMARFAFGLEVPVGVLLAVAAFTAASNTLLARTPRRFAARADAFAAAALALDVVLLTVLLGATGGPANPFSVLYLVHVSLAALLFGFRWSLAIAALCAAAYATLFVAHVPVAWDHAEHAGHDAGRIGLHLQGMWAATAIAALALSYFIARIAGALRERDARLRELERITSRSEKLVALSALAAGAAHELGSPLTTIAVAARELERAAERIGGAAALVEDARLIRAQAGRCREILAQMSGELGTDTGEGLEPVVLASVVAAVEARLDAAERARLRIACGTPGATLRAPRAALAQALLSPIRNGLAASPDGPVWIRADAAGERVRFEVRDEGAGMSPAVLARAGEPFFSTRAPGGGMGLGLFLTRAIVEHLGGQLALESTLGRGTRVVIEMPRDPLGRVLP